MAKRPVVEVKCGRCARTEYREEPVDDGEEETKDTFFASLQTDASHTMIIQFEDLCTPCVNTVKGHLDQIGKKIEGLSPIRGKREKKAALEEVQVEIEEHLPNGG